jgi:hypothetical protein
LVDILIKEMLLGFAKAKKLKDGLYSAFVTLNCRLIGFILLLLHSYKLASALVSSMKVEVVCRDTRINELLGIHPMSY